MTGVFADALSLRQEAERLFTAETHLAYQNMVGPFGGITAAVALRACAADPRAKGRPSGMTINFTSPLADGSYTITTNVPRSNNSNQHWTFSIDQNGENRAIGTVLLIAEREAWANQELTMAHVPSFDNLEPIGSSQMRLMPRWAHNYDMRFVTGLPPLASTSPATDSVTQLWLRRQEDSPWTHEALAAACDVFAPRIFQRAAGAVPSGTVTLTSYFHASPSELTQIAPEVFAEVQGVTFAGGMADQRGSLWSSTGKLLATTVQLCYFKLPPQ